MKRGVIGIVTALFFLFLFFQPVSGAVGVINRPPVVSPAPILYLIEGQDDGNSVIDLSDYARDPEGERLEFSFDEKDVFVSEIIDCSIASSRLICEIPKKEGTLSLEITVSDREKSSVLSIPVDVLPATAFGETGGSYSGSINSPPKADAGDDIQAFSNQVVILDGSGTYDLDNNIPAITEAYEWYYNKEIIGKGRVIEAAFANTGSHEVFLKVTDSKGASSTDKVIVKVTKKKSCRNSDAVYFPQDTGCNDKWPSKEGKSISINSEINSCSLFEVCDDSADYVVRDSIFCCKDREMKDENKQAACDYAVKYSGNSQKKCQAIYVIQSLGVNAIYMNDYFEAEMCCYGEESLCSSQQYLYKAKPVPVTRFPTNDFRCYNTKNSRDKGYWISDLKIDRNNIALSDVPAHVSINILGTGTCVDYSAALTTLLRKIGYRKDEVYTIETPTHAYNLVRFPYDRKYTVVDTTGNNNPAVIFGKTPSQGQRGFDYCSNIKKCYNDKGSSLCPTPEWIYGCENAKISYFRKISYSIAKIKTTFGSFFRIVGEEMTR
jgi:hypothetical protein